MDTWPVIAVDTWSVIAVETWPVIAMDTWPVIAVDTWPVIATNVSDIPLEADIENGAEFVELYQPDKQYFCTSIKHRLNSLGK
jgi:hypothetical protein